MVLSAAFQNIYLFALAIFSPNINDNLFFSLFFFVCSGRDFNAFVEASLQSLKFYHDLKADQENRALPTNGAHFTRYLKQQNVLFQTVLMWVNRRISHLSQNCNAIERNSTCGWVTKLIKSVFTKKS